MPAPVGPFPLDQVQMPTWLLRFDKHGACTSPATQQALLDHLRDDPAGRLHTDIVFFSHGWNNDFDEAVEMYSKFLRNFEVLNATYMPGRVFNPLFVGVLWPSIWFSFDSGPAIASAGAVPGEQAESITSDADGLIKEALAEQLVLAGQAASLERVYALLAQPSLNADQTRELAGLLAPAFGSITDDESAAGTRATSADDLLGMLQAMQGAMSASQTAPATSTDIDNWGEPPPEDESGSTSTAGASTGALPGIKAAGFLDLVDPRNALRLFSVYQMKDRAGVVGAHGIAALLRDVLQHSAATQPRVHAVGHSYGCKVMLSAVCSPAPLQRPLSSLLLLQPAISHLSFADVLPEVGKPGGYRSALNADRVTSPIYSTYSRKDIPLHDTFHLALRRDSDLGDQDIGIAAGPEDTTAGKPPSRFAALGGYGPRRAGQLLVDPMPIAGKPYPVAPAGTGIVSFDGSQDVIHGHGDITTSAAAWALNRLVFR